MELIESGAKRHTVSASPMNRASASNSPRESHFISVDRGFSASGSPIAELASVGLRTDYTTIEEDIVPNAIGAVVGWSITPNLRGYVERHRCRVVEFRVLHRAVQGDNPQEIAGACLGGLVRPEKTLDGMLGCGDEGAGRQSLIPFLEAPNPP
jgi:hypothetical protein